jgi:hypothetical protein
MSVVGDSLPNCQPLYKMALIKRIGLCDKYLLALPFYRDLSKDAILSQVDLAGQYFQ